MSLTAALTAAGAIAGGLGSIADIGLGIANYGLQEKAYRQDQENLAITRSREDNAIQRRVADLRAAGLSPTLAAGSPAQAAMAPKVTAPQINMKTDFNKAFEGAAMAAQLMQQKADIARTNADIRRTELESAKIQKETAMLDDKGTLLKGDIKAQELERAIKSWDFDYFWKLGIPTSTRGDLMQILSAVKVLGKQLGITSLEDLAQKTADAMFNSPLNLLPKNLTAPFTEPVKDAVQSIKDKVQTTGRDVQEKSLQQNKDFEESLKKNPALKSLVEWYQGLK